MVFVIGPRSSQTSLPSPWFKDTGKKLEFTDMLGECVDHHDIPKNAANQPRGVYLRFHPRRRSVMLTNAMRTQVSLLAIVRSYSLDN